MNLSLAQIQLLFILLQTLSISGQKEKKNDLRSLQLKDCYYLICNESGSLKKYNKMLKFLFSSKW